MGLKIWIIQTLTINQREDLKVLLKSQIHSYLMVLYGLEQNNDDDKVKIINLLLKKELTTPSNLF